MKRKLIIFLSISLLLFITILTAIKDIDFTNTGMLITFKNSTGYYIEY